MTKIGAQQELDDGEEGSECLQASAGEGSCTIVRKGELRGGMFREGPKGRPACSKTVGAGQPRISIGLLPGSPWQPGRGVQTGVPTVWTCTLRRGGGSKASPGVIPVLSWEQRLFLWGIGEKLAPCGTGPLGFWPTSRGGCDELRSRD